MSIAAAHESEDVRRSCPACHERKARTLCFECYRMERAAQRVADGSGTRPLYVPGDFSGRPLTDREVAHRQQMLAHLASGASSL